MRHFIEVGEYGLALEDIADTLAQAEVAITDQECSDMLALTATMNLDDLAPVHWGSACASGSGKMQG